MVTFLKKIFYFYYNGFRSMTWGRSLWIIILIKLFIIFFVLKVFFFRDFLDTKFRSNHEKEQYILEQISGK
jgi:uncharacterized membrane protein